MRIPGNGNSGVPLAIARSKPKLSRGTIGDFVSQMRRRIIPGQVDLFHTLKISTLAFSELLHASAAIIVHKDRYTYFINEADFSHGQFAAKRYLGTKDLGWDRFDQLFPKELEITMPQKAVIVPNIKADALMVVDRAGNIVERQVSQEKVGRLIFDYGLQERGSVMLVPIISNDAESAQRAMAYLYSLETDHFSLPQSGYGAHLLAGVVAPTLKTLI